MRSSVDSAKNASVVLGSVLPVEFDFEFLDWLFDLRVVTHEPDSHSVADVVLVAVDCDLGYALFGSKAQEPANSVLQLKL
jgi:hypothetical protein